MIPIQAYRRPLYCEVEHDGGVRQPKIPELKKPLLNVRQLEYPGDAGRKVVHMSERSDVVSKERGYKCWAAWSDCSSGSILNLLRMQDQAWDNLERDRTPELRVWERQKGITDAGYPRIREHTFLLIPVQQHEQPHRTRI